MKRKNILILTAVFICIISWGANAQTADTGASPADQESLEANSQITDVIVTSFEDPSFWKGYMPLDQGVITTRKREGVPMQAKEEKEKDLANKVPDYPLKNVLGAKIEYISRGHNWFVIRPVRPLQIEGECKSLSIYVAGRNYRHTLKILIQDFWGKEMELTVSELNFVGWKKLHVPVPPHIKQMDYHFLDRRGIKFTGIKIECDPAETFGTYYVYFDQLRAKTDLFLERYRDEDDMADNW